jgi:hypothetical protein
MSYTTNTHKIKYEKKKGSRYGIKVNHPVYDDIIDGILTDMNHLNSIFRDDIVALNLGDVYSIKTIGKEFQKLKQTTVLGRTRLLFLEIGKLYLNDYDDICNLNKLIASTFPNLETWVFKCNQIILSDLVNIAYHFGEFPNSVQRFIFCSEKTPVSIHTLDTNLREVHINTHRDFPCKIGKLDFKMRKLTYNTTKYWNLFADRPTPTKYHKTYHGWRARTVTSFGNAIEHIKVTK